MKRVMFIFGTRPEAIKMAPVISAFKSYPDKLEPVIVVTGQHRHMLDQVLSLFDIEPDYDLEIMRKDQSLADIINRSLRGLEKIMVKEQPDMLLVQGDTSTAFASALLAYYFKIPVGHVEAGLRTFDKWRPFPEEINRKLIGAVADLHFAPTENAVSNLLSERVERDFIYLTGNTVIDALRKVAERKFDLKKAGLNLSPDKKLVLVTVHRRETFGKAQEEMCLALARLAKEYSEKIEIVLPVHKNPKVRKTVKKVLGDIPNVKLIEPLDYEPFVHLMKAAYLIITDSGGVQEEAPTLGKPVLVMREKTERPEAVAFGTAKLVGIDRNNIFAEASRLINDEREYDRMSKAVNPYGDGKAAQRIALAILYYFGVVDQKPEEFAAAKPCVK